MKRSARMMLLTGLLLFVCMLASLLMMSNSLQDSSHFSRFYLGLLVFNTMGLLALVTLIIINLRRLIRQLRRKAPGSRMTVRMVAMFTILSVTPVLVVYYFSLDFLNRGIDNWFDLRVEQALDDSLELSRLSLDTRMRELLKKTSQIASDLSDISDVAIPFEIDDMRASNGIKELTLFSRQGKIIASSGDDPTRLVPDRPSNTILLQLQQGNSYTGLDIIRNKGLHIRIVVNVPVVGIEQDNRIIQALYPISGRINDLAKSVQTSYVKYKELSYLREQLKKSFVIILTLVLLFSIFSTVWAAFYTARRQVEPVRNLAEGTLAVARGNYETQIPVPGNDELGFLVSSFNEMTRKIAQAQFEAETQRSYLEAVLERLSSGVLVLDKENILRTTNTSVEKILDIPLSEMVGKPISEIAGKYPAFGQLIAAIEVNLTPSHRDWREQVNININDQYTILMCSGTALLETHHLEQGRIIVIDDITALIQGQRNAALSEMARRLAHEIKNPLTPIQLATERLRHKYLENLQGEDTETFDRLTNTIIQQVETMKDMVNSFSEFSRVPDLKMQLIDVNEILIEVTDLFANLNQNASIETSLYKNLPLVQADVSRLRQVFNNLLKNAFDACEQCRKFRLEISTGITMDNDEEYVEIIIRDSGTGISAEIMHKMFDPYITTKTKGTGLGLAIIRKIVEEHKGKITLVNNTDAPGASAIVLLPVAKQESVGTVKSDITGAVV